MKTLATLTLCVSLLLGGVALAGEITEMEGRSDMDAEGLYLLFVSKPVEEGSAFGDAFVALGKGETPATLGIEPGYGMYIQGGVTSVAAVSPEIAAEVWNSETGPAARVIAVRIDEDQYGKIAAVIERWSKIETLDIQPAHAALDATHEALKIVGYVSPYRSGLGMVHMMHYYSDIQTRNRKHTL